VKLRWKSALGIALSAGGLWWALHGVPWHDVIDRLRHASVPLIILCSVAATGIFPLRAIRWQIILDPVVPDLPIAPLWRSVAIGAMANNVLPARAGELARAYALTRERPEVSFSTSFASLAVDRLFDGAAVLLLMGAAMLDPHFPGIADLGGRSVASAGIGVVGITLAGFLALYVLASYPQRMIRIYEAFARRVAPAIEERGRRILTSFASGLSVLRSPRRFLLVLWWALLHWLLNAFAFWLAFKAVHVDVPLSAALFVQGVIVVFVSIPSTPGFAGVFEAGAKMGLNVYGIGATAAATWALLFHVVSYIPITLMGAWYLTRAGITYGEIQAAAGRDGAPSGTP